MYKDTIDDDRDGDLSTQFTARLYILLIIYKIIIILIIYL